MIALITGHQDTGKTATMLATALELTRAGGYSPAEMIGNLMVKVPGYTRLDNANLREYLKQTITKGIRHKIILIDEIDGVFPARFWQSRSQTESLLGLWQDFKLFLWIIATGHAEGAGADVLIRRAQLIEIVPNYNLAEDRIYLEVNNRYKGRIFRESIYPASALFPLYKRWDPIK